MARNYEINGSRAVASPTKTLIGLTSNANVRPLITDILMGSVATPADNALEWLLQRYTAVGVGTTETPTALDPADPAPQCTSLTNHTTEPTYTSGAILFDLAMNQRASQRWVPSPGREIKLPATANNGAGLQPIHSSFTGTVNSTIYFED